MTSKTVSQLLADLGVLQSHSRPHISNDNPYSEAQFKTLEYSPRFPKKFTSIIEARAFLDAAYTAHPGRFRKPPCAPHIPQAAWINEPQETPLSTTAI